MLSTTYSFVLVKLNFFILLNKIRSRIKLGIEDDTCDQNNIFLFMHHYYLLRVCDRNHYFFIPRHSLKKRGLLQT